MKRQSTRWLAWIAVVIVCVGTGLRLYRIEAQSLWHDEGNSAAMIGRTPDQIAQAAAADIHPPLYYWLLAAWGSLAGNSELALRFPSAVAGILTIAVMIRLGARLFNRPAGALAGLLAAVSPFQVYYGQEARMYALLALLSATSVLMTIRVLELPGAMAQGRASRARVIGVTLGYVLVNAAGLYTHYTFPLAIAAETLVFMLWLARRRGKLHGVAIWGGLQIATLILFLPWLPVVVRQLQAWPRLTAGPVNAPVIARTLFYGITLTVSEAGIGIMALAALAAFSLVPPAPGEDARHLRWSERMALPIAWLAIPLAALVWQGALREPTLKFLLSGSLALGLLIARGATLSLELAVQPSASRRGPSILPRLIAPALLAIGSAPIVSGLQNLYFNPIYARDDYREIARRIMAEAGPQAAVILIAPNQREVFTYYYPDGPGITLLPNQTPVKTVMALLESHPRVYAIFWASQEQDPLGKVENALQRRAYIAETQWHGNARLAVFLSLGEPSDVASHLLEVWFGDPTVIKLAGFNVSADSLRPGDSLGVTLFWEAPSPVEQRLRVFVHLIGPDGSLVAQHDGEPRGGLSPTTGWLPNTPVMDNHGLILPSDLPPGEYSLRVGLYGGGEGDRLIATLNSLPIGDSVEIQRIKVTAP